MSINIGLTCWHCRKTVFVEVQDSPRFAFEVAAYANAAGLLGVMDLFRGRALVFCNQEHADAEKTKHGAYRLRPKGMGKATA